MVCVLMLAVIQLIQMNGDIVASRNDKLNKSKFPSYRVTSCVLVSLEGLYIKISRANA